MKYLFVHQNFPGQFLHIVRDLVAKGDNEIVFLTQANANHLAGVRKIVYQIERKPGEDTHADARDFELAVIRAEVVARTARRIKKLGFTPDIIIGHHGWGELLNIQDVWPGVPVLGYCEFYYHADGVDVGFDPEFPVHATSYPRVRAKNTVNLLALTNPGHGQSPTQWQRSTYPDWAQRKITVVPEGVNLNLCKPDPSARTEPLVLGDFTVAPGEKLITYVSRDLEPYRGFHIIMRALPAVLKARPDVRVVLVGGDGVSYGARLANGTWREHMLGEVGASLDLSRVHFPGKVSYDTYRRLLQRSDAHVYLTYPFVASWSLREALAIGCPVIGSDTEPVREFLTHGQNGLLTPFLDWKALSARILEVLEDRDLAQLLGENARDYAMKNLAMAGHMRAYRTLIRKLTGKDTPAPRRPAAPPRIERVRRAAELVPAE